MVNVLRAFYRKYVHSPAVDRTIYAALDSLTNLLARYRRFSFPANYIRRWKLNMLWGLYEPETYRLFKEIITHGMTVVDIGAHIGYFTRLFQSSPEHAVRFLRLRQTRQITRFFRITRAGVATCWRAGGHHRQHRHH